MRNCRVSQPDRSAAEGVIRGKLPPDDNPQRRHVRREEHFCGAELALREQKYIPCGFAARERRRRERQIRQGKVWEGDEVPVPVFLFRPQRDDRVLLGRDPGGDQAGDEGERH